MALAEQCNAQAVKGEAFNFSPESRVSVIEITKALQTGDGSHRPRARHPGPGPR
jgi:hypothetical protein